ncbi:CAT RNA binding domain [Propionibacterium ruminifibrarum]|uniref:CAT RNA binding domain n=1 Tax=Propionibacterium ruminifibrarum TaxID=1962131 RepID=A0A375I1N7_9ACTN|nr:CAT RNA binding domain-containing protein [Propionibacterium ruminifibrarum]SPF67112.1 CAT RNA binding domain [Propionibacterium ruminifibrarum]
MEVLRVFNNNVVLARDELGREVVVTGRGVGFKKKSGDPVDPALTVTGQNTTQERTTTA